MNYLDYLNDNILDLIYKYVHKLRMKDICKEIYDANHFEKEININGFEDKSIGKYMNTFLLSGKFANVTYYIRPNKYNLWGEIRAMNTIFHNNKNNIIIKRDCNEIKINSKIQKKEEEFS